LLHIVRPAPRQRWGVAVVAALGLFVGSIRAGAQGTSGTITGRVTDGASNSPLVSANVRIVGTTIGTQTGTDGRYTIHGVTPGTVDLQVNRIGYQAKHASVTVAAGQTATADVSLSQAAFSLATVVTTVTGAQSKASLSNTVATIDVGDKIAETPVTTTGELLSGRASGVQVVSGGAVGSGSRIRIRGQSSLSLSNDPIIYVDGIRVNGSSAQTIGTGGSPPSALDNIAPEEIETIDVIKGPAAATLYGTQAANGVILITTKKGKAGAPRWNAFSENGVLYDSHKGNYPDLWVAFDNTLKPGTPQVCLLMQEAVGTCHIDSTYHNNVLNDPLTTPLQTGNRAQYGLQVQGGATALQYFLSGDVEHDQGPYKMPTAEINRLVAERGTSIGDDQIYPNANKQVNLRSNLTAELSSKANIAVQVGYVDSDIREPQNEDNSDGLMVDALGGSARSDLTDARGVALNGYRLFPMGDIFAQRDNANLNRFINSLNAQYYPVSWLTTRANLGYDYSARNETFLQEYNQGPYNDTYRNATTNGYVRNDRNENDIYTVDLGATATTPFKRFSSKLSGGVQYFHTFSSTTEGTGQNLPPGGTTTSAGAIRASTQATTESINLGSYGEEVLSYADRVFLTGGLRYDANSAFGESFSGVYYPKIGLSWLISDENWFPRIDALNSFRLRGTYGTSGVQPGTTAALRYYTPRGADVNGSEQSSVSLGALGNPNLKPEYSGEFETGFDLTAFSSYSTFEFTYYNKHTKDALIAAPTSPSLGGSISTEYENLGATRNQGYELTWNQKILDNSQVGAEIQMTGSINKNRILTLGQGITPIFTGNRSTQYNAPGYPLFGLWGKTYTYSDPNGDGLLAVSDVKISDTAVFIGPTYPTHEFALNPRLELLHRKLAITAQFDHKDGMTKFYNTLRHRCAAGQNCPELFDPNASLADQAAAIADNNYGVYTGMYYNGEFTRLRELAVSYQLPDKFAARIHSTRAMIVGTGRNLHVWTKYPGIDPEASVNTADDRGNEEYFSTPPLRYFTLRLQLAF
jgi:TonB-linked SusC/RagA family outer membrane protein